MASVGIAFPWRCARVSEKRPCERQTECHTRHQMRGSVPVGRTERDVPSLDTRVNRYLTSWIRPENCVFVCGEARG